FEWPGMRQAAENADAAAKPERTNSIGVRCVFRRLERDLHVRLSRQIIDLAGLGLLDDTNQVCRVRNVAIMQMKPNPLFVRIVVEVIDARRVERGRTSLYSMHNVALGQQQFSQISPVLPRGTSNKCGSSRRL